MNTPTICFTVPNSSDPRHGHASWELVLTSDLWGTVPQGKPGPLVKVGRPPERGGEGRESKGDSPWEGASSADPAVPPPCTGRGCPLPAAQPAEDSRSPVAVGRSIPRSNRRAAGAAGDGGCGGSGVHRLSRGANCPVGLTTNRILNGA